MNKRTAFSLIEMMVVFAIISVLLGLLLPAVMRVRDMASRNACLDNLKKMGVALHGYHAQWNVFPPSAINPCHYQSYYESWPKSFYPDEPTYVGYNHSGFTLLLPYLGHEDLYKRYNFKLPACNATIGVPFVLGGDASGLHISKFLLANYVDKTVYTGDTTNRYQVIGNGVNGTVNEEIVGTYIPEFACFAEGKPDVVTYKPDCLTTSFLGDAWSRTNARRSNYLFCSTEFEGVLYRRHAQSTTLGLTGTNGAARIEDVISGDGLSSTVAIGESRQIHADPPGQPYMNGPNWGTAARGSVVGLFLNTFFMINYPSGSLYYPANDPRSQLSSYNTFGSGHADGANFLFADGAARFLPNKTSFPILDAISDINGGGSVTVDYLYN